MKRLLMLLFVALLLSGAPNVCSAAGPYVGLFADSTHTIASVYYWPGPTSFELWLWCLPSAEGIHGVECSLEFPYNVTPGERTMNPVIPGCCGDPNLCSCVFGDCQSDWVWLFRQECVLTDFVHTVIQVLPYSGSGDIQVTTCESGFPIKPAIPINFELNFMDGVGGRTWGAIKSLFEGL